MLSPGSRRSATDLLKGNPLGHPSHPLFLRFPTALFSTILVGNFFGGELVYRMGMRVSTGAPKGPVIVALLSLWDGVRRRGKGGPPTDAPGRPGDSAEAQKDAPVRSSEGQQSRRE